MKVLIFSSSAGNGHNSTATRLTEKILEHDKDAQIEIVDAYKSYAPKLKAWIMEQGYFIACNHFVGIYNHFFKKSEKSTPENRDKAKANDDTYSLLYGMLNKIYDYKPDVIISTYIFCSVALTNIKRYYKIPAKIICMTLDYGISPYWECCANGLDYMFLTGDYMIEKFKELGYTDKQLIVSGIPVADKFFIETPQKDDRKNLGLDEKLFTILVMKASFFPVKNKQLMKQFALIKDKIQIIIINGKDAKSKKDFDKRITKANLQHKFFNLGFVNDIPGYLNSADIVLGKAGGLSCTEEISTGTPCLIVDKLPQQEIYNKNYLVDNKCALPVNKNNIAENIEYLLHNKKTYKELQNNAIKTRKPYPLEKFYNVISSCPKADYSNLKLTDNKRQVIDNIHSKRKEAIKNSKQNQ